MRKWTVEEIMKTRFLDQLERADRVSEYLDTVLPAAQPLRILEIGSSLGCLSAKLQERHLYEIHAVEPINADVAYCPENYRGIHLQNCRLQDMTTYEFDTVICVLPFVPCSERDDFLSTLRRVMKPHAKFICFVWKGTSFFIPGVETGCVHDMKVIVVSASSADPGNVLAQLTP